MWSNSALFLFICIFLKEMSPRNGEGGWRCLWLLSTGFKYIGAVFRLKAGCQRESSISEINFRVNCAPWHHLKVKMSADITFFFFLSSQLGLHVLLVCGEQKGKRAESKKKHIKIISARVYLYIHTNAFAAHARTHSKHKKVNFCVPVY